MTDFAIPAGSCDTHVHVYRKGAPTVPGALAAPVEDDVARYRQTRRALGLSRAVIVQPTAYGTDNTVSSEAIEALGREQTRGVAVVDDAVSDRALRDLSEAGFCGARLQMLAGGVIPWDQVDRIAERVATCGWHVQLQLDGHDLPQRADQILSWPGTVVIDHIGKFLDPVAPDHPAFHCLLRLIDTGRVWVKLSAPYEVSRIGQPGYDDVSALARALVRHAPERMLWASNWPHIQIRPRPDDAKMLKLLGDWAPDPAVRDRILCENPAVVYGFKSAIMGEGIAPA
ncbi:amidohydrolase [Pseudooceanicola sediminis]|uniref:Amidohydrolase n=1 Tax=Pseudooceanicola sediminis TaxID=2211117 RepID=A0A399IYH0_9RHOB|nr:amidohydrolase family protein [Pseudooceanicola sediminis]KAA2314929.1 amidohydrolase family protein [Puniceibacterium sp. HSS470]RII37299.1 amidohydrolase [Pseudooceanicola sediminis]|tara:strand:+ start:28157 stop:29011 length:855 start_codon:yes stop_codon:yes gene_type:complete